jgi:undecaprenyl-diphosphatase
MELSERKLLAGIQQLDLLTFGWCHARARINTLAEMARKVSRSADGWIYLLLPLLYTLIYGGEARAFVSIAALAFGLERLVYLVLKNTCRRRRPPDFIPHFRSFVTPGDTFSFPSGHTSAAFLFAGLCAGEFGMWAALLLYPWAALVGVSRVLLGVHFPSDIVAGALLGSGLLIASQELVTTAGL